MTHVHTLIDSPIGPLTLVASNGVLSGLFMDGQQNRPDDSALGERDNTAFSQVTIELNEYFAGDRKTFDVELAPVGNPFQLQVWTGLRSIGYGETISYGVLAERIGKPGAARSVGTINGQNPISIIIPCHRVIGANGKLVGYNGGLERKEFLLNLEKQATSPVVEVAQLFT